MWPTWSLRCFTYLHQGWLIVHFFHSTRLMWNILKCCTSYYHLHYNLIICCNFFKQLLVNSFSSNSSSLLEELKSKCDKMNFIGSKWNEPSKIKMKWDFQNFKNIQISWHSQMTWKTWNFQVNEIEKRGKNGIPPIYITSRALNEKLPQPHKP